MVTAAHAAALYPREVDDGFLLLATITVDTTIIRVTANPVDVVSNGLTYTAFPFTVQLSCDSDRPPEAQIAIAGVGREIIEAIEESGSTAAPEIEFQVVLVSNLDSVVATHRSFKLRDLTVDAVMVTGAVSQDRISNEQYPSIRATRERCPGLF